MDEKNVIHVSEKEIVEVTTSYDRIDDEIDQDAFDNRHKDINILLGNLFNYAELGREVKNVVDPELDYVVKFTPELLKKMKEHDIQFLKDKATGELLPDLYDYTDKAIGGKVRLELKGKPTEQDLTNISNSINNIIEQQRYDALMEEVQQLHVVAKRIERGQDNDRFAKVNAGRKHLIDALQYHGSEEDQKKMIMDAVMMLREGRELIEKTLLDKMDALEPVPEKTLKRLWYCFKDSKYFPEQISRYDDVQEYFQYYYMSIQPMAYAYTKLNQPQLVESLLEDSKKVFEHRNIDRLESVELLLPNREFDSMWYKNSIEHENRLIEAFKGPNEDDDVKIIIRGSELLEVIDNERGEEKESD